MDERSNNNEQAVWYAIRVTYNREMKVKAELDELKIRSFVPMQYKAQVRDGRLVKRLVPSVHNLIFIYITPSGMRDYKERTSLPIRYIMRRHRSSRSDGEFHSRSRHLRRATGLPLAQAWRLQPG